MTKNLDLRPSIRSTWRDAIGPVLTDRRITNRQKQGWYGEKAKQQALSRSRTKMPDGVLVRCKCGETKAVAYFDYLYLTAPGFYCPACLEQQRLSRPVRMTKEERFNALIHDYLV